MPNIVDLIKGDRIQLIINTPRGQDTFFNEKAIRRTAVLARIPTITTIAAAQAAVEGISDYACFRIAGWRRTPPADSLIAP
jgi:carbamoyl-phosphate synthase large subunit